MSKKQKILFFILLVAIGSIGFFIWAYFNFSGDVVGPNPQHIPKHLLPACDFNGFTFVKEPCLSPKGARYG